MRDKPAWVAFGVVSVIAVGCTVLRPAAEPAPGSPTRSSVDQLLDQVRVIDSRPRPGGYERGCKPGQGCVFGPAWTDDQDAPGGHDGCDTRNNVLHQQLTAVTLKPGTRDCVVLAGTLADPYTGKEVDFARAKAGTIEIDHVYALAAAWDFGASNWPREKRLRFANDITYELLAVGSAANQAKKDYTPANWMPDEEAQRCFYAGKYLTVAVQYDLPISRADEKALRRGAASCP